EAAAGNDSVELTVAPAWGGSRFATGGPLPPEGGPPGARTTPSAPPPQPCAPRGRAAPPAPPGPISGQGTGKRRDMGYLLQTGTRNRMVTLRGTANPDCSDSAIPA